MSLRPRLKLKPLSIPDDTTSDDITIDEAIVNISNKLNIPNDDLKKIYYKLDGPNIDLKTFNFNSISDQRLDLKNMDLIKLSTSFKPEKTKNPFTSYLSRNSGEVGIPCKLKYFKLNTTYTYVIKLFIYDKQGVIGVNTQNLVTAKILAEIYFQQQAVLLENKCEFNVPKIKIYGYIENHNYGSNKIVFYILMELADGRTIDTLNITDKNIACTKLKNITKCLEENQLYHNDLNSGNVLVNTNNNITIIDYGESGKKPTDVCYKPYCDLSTGGSRRKKLRKSKKTKQIKKTTKIKKLRKSKKLRKY